MVCHIIFWKTLGLVPKGKQTLWAPRSYHAEHIQQIVNIILESYAGGKKYKAHTWSCNQGRLATGVKNIAEIDDPVKPKT